MKRELSFLDYLEPAFKKVRSNKGCPGVDGVSVIQFGNTLTENLRKLRLEVTRRSYIPLPLLKILVSKKNGELRSLCIPAVRDRVLQTAVLKEIEPILEEEFEKCSYAYRKGMSVRKAIQEVIRLYEKGYRWVVDADIDAFFDSVDHDLLFQKIDGLITNPDCNRLIKKWIKAEVWDGTSIQPMKKGIPQGSPVSPILANLFLDELDESLINEGLKHVRYADDFIVLCKDPRQAEKALEITEEILEGLRLKLDEGNLTSFDRGFKFLGFICVKSIVLKQRPPSIQKNLVSFPKQLDLESYFRTKRNI